MGRVRAAALCGLVSAAVLSSPAAADAAAEAPAEEQDATTAPYVAPQVEGLHWAETFDGDVWSRWTQSSHEKYNGKFAVEPRTAEALVGDLGLLVPEEARHYGISSTFKPLVGSKEAPFVAQYEVKLQDGLSCGGAYLKLYDSTAAAGGFKDDTPYVIMFGPDRCGATDKVHFILRHRSPKTGDWEEKHFKEPPSAPQDRLTHLYGLVIRPDNSFEIQIDGVTKASGNLLSSMSPSVNPPKDIDDPADFKPEDWVDEAKMDDPEASKPDDWDEDQPSMIPDPAASKPAGWVDDAESKIPDPSAEKPEGWDDDEDGEWEAPIIDNPVCTVGCGTWSAPKISNPLYKGKWHAPTIDNPDYKGVWRPRQIPNPDYFFDEAPAMLPRIDSVGIDIWTMSKGILFDNIVISDSEAKARAFADASFKLRKELEDKQQPKTKDPVMDVFWNNWHYFAAGGAVLLVLVLFLCCRGDGDTPAAESEEEKLARRAKRRAEQDAQKKAKEDDNSASAAAEEKPEGLRQRKGEKKQEEGGLGDLGKADD